MSPAQTRRRAILFVLGAALLWLVAAVVVLLAVAWAIRSL